MSTHTQEILKAAQYNQKLAIEIYCELYIYQNYTEDQVGIDCPSDKYKDEINPNANSTNTSWMNNLMYRLNSIFRRRGIKIRIDVEETKELLENSEVLLPSTIWNTYEEVKLLTSS